MGMKFKSSNPDPTGFPRSGFKHRYSGKTSKTIMIVGIMSPEVPEFPQVRTV